MLIALGVVAVIVVALVIIMTMAASKPDTFRVERTATIKADPGKVFSSINDFHNWAAWSPFEKLDPNMPRGNTTEVSWAVYGPSPFMMKIMHVFMNMDHMMGKDFETGLANLKTVAER